MSTITRKPYSDIMASRSMTQRKRAVVEYHRLVEKSTAKFAGNLGRNYKHLHTAMGEQPGKIAPQTLQKSITFKSFRNQHYIRLLLFKKKI